MQHKTAKTGVEFTTAKIQLNSTLDLVLAKIGQIPIRSPLVYAFGLKISAKTSPIGHEKAQEENLESKY